VRRGTVKLTGQMYSHTQPSLGMQPNHTFYEMGFRPAFFVFEHILGDVNSRDME
jgi:hypothetical protein